jgi:hypothetical protein
MLAGVFGLVLAPPADRATHALLLVVILFICAVHTVVFGHSRYHLPIMPIVLLYAAAAIVQAREIWARRYQWSFRLAGLLVAVLVLAWSWEILVVDGTRFRDAFWGLFG